MTDAPAGRAPIRICFILPSLSAGGAERVMITLMNGLDRAHFEPVFIAIDSTGPYAGLIAPHVRVVKLERRGFIRAAPALAKALRAVRPDVTMTTLPPLNFMVLALRPLLPAKMKIAARETITPSFLLDHPRLWNRVMSRLGWRFLYPRADLVISPTGLVFSELEARLGLRLSNAFILPNPVDVDGIRAKAALPLPPEDDWFRAGALKLITVGRLHYQKGYDRLIQALGEHPPEGDWQLEIVGDGPERPALEGLIRRHRLEDRIRLTGFRDNPWQFVARADAFILCSRWEGLPNAVLESLAVGTSVLALPDAQSIHEIKADTEGQALTIARDMQDLLAEIGKLRAADHDPARRPSLLPQKYGKPGILDVFSQKIAAIFSET